MTAITYLSALRLYGADVLLLALGVTLVTSLLKKTVLKNANRKIFVLLPFALGLAFYCGFRMLASLSVLPLTEDFLSTAEGGFAVGCAATLYYVVYEQFFRSSESSPDISALTPLLTGFVPEGSEEQAAQALLAGLADKTEEELSAFVSETLRSYCETLSADALALYARLVSGYLSAVFL